jgi:hypothetical protein
VILATYSAVYPLEAGNHVKSERFHWIKSPTTTSLGSPSGALAASNKFAIVYRHEFTKLRPT